MKNKQLLLFKGCRQAAFLFWLYVKCWGRAKEGKIEQLLQPSR